MWRTRSRARVRRRSRRRRPQGQALQPFVGPFHLPRAQFDALDRRRRDGRVAAALPDVRRSRAVLPPRGVVGRPDVRGDLRLSRAARCSTTRATLASRCSSRTSFVTSPSITGAAASICRSRISRDSAAPRPTSAAKSKQAGQRRAGRRRFAPCSSTGVARARLLLARRPRAADDRRLALRRRRDHARDLLGAAAAHRGGAMRRLQRADSRSAAGAGADLATQDLVDDSAA